MQGQQQGCKPRALRTDTDTLQPGKLHSVSQEAEVRPEEQEFAQIISQGQSDGAKGGLDS